jgi:NAD(P)-dependent dehydrogenase (short-subunit alcohol dehydrogenase family)
VSEQSQAPLGMLSGKVAVITGAGRALAARTALAL